MLVVHGVRQLRPKRIAFRNDYCLTCQQPRRSVLIQTLNFWHVYWIPVVPLGFRKRWVCITCERPPHVVRKTRRPLLRVALVLLLISSGISWVNPVNPDAVVIWWFFRIGAPIGAVLLLVLLLRTRMDAALREHLSAIAPATDTVCPFCGKQLLVLASGCTCPGCGVMRI
jgi:hypothetical protein